ncbi:hypothetical protein L6164_025893 [Bauhinia variegata]|uniref:Uncharacterized protein n=1 Tax=Bauhinia variegata TaxID=167791 RepID=A0ACB9M222_BAUVA|nr:hypothetical protein L6164_025893 [Bauhinia variegata]
MKSGKKKKNRNTMKSNQKSHMADVCPLQSERSCDPEGDRVDEPEGRNSTMDDIDQNLSRWDDFKWIDLLQTPISRGLASRTMENGKSHVLDGENKVRIEEEWAQDLL